MGLVSRMVQWFTHFFSCLQEKLMVTPSGGLCWRTLCIYRHPNHWATFKRFDDLSLFSVAA
jgi:hypothetical protein